VFFQHWLFRAPLKHLDSWSAGQVGLTWAYDFQDNVPSHNQLGLWHLQRQEAPEAIAEFRAALQLNPSSGVAAAIQNNLGLAAEAVGDYPAAFEAFQQACRLQPTYLLFRENLAHAYALAKLLPQAKNSLLDTLALNPADAEAWLLLGLLYREGEADERNPVVSAACFQQFIRLQPESEMSRAVRRLLK
jgi:tetratricopeptide (TPR) repeat protein